MLKVATGARLNLAAAVNLVIVHNERPIPLRSTGSQASPRTSLNRAIVLLAVGAWERFVADAVAAVKDPVAHGSVWMVGDRTSRVSDAYAEAAEQRLVNGRVASSFRSRWSATVAGGWAGRRLEKLEVLTGLTPGMGLALSLCQHLDQWVELRNGLAHHEVVGLARRADDAQLWKAMTPGVSIQG
jgi:hypothetical protein